MSVCVHVACCVCVCSLFMEEYPEEKAAGEGEEGGREG